MRALIGASLVLLNSPAMNASHQNCRTRTIGRWYWRYLGMDRCAMRGISSSLGKCTARQKKPDSPCGLRLRFYEFEQVCIDAIGMRGRHTVRESRIGLERPVLQKLDRFCSRS